MEFKIEDLAVLASDIRYAPALGVAVNRLLTARNPVEYEIALKETTQIALGFENIQIYDRKEYGMSSYLPGMPLWQPLLLEANHEDVLEDLLLESAIVDLSRQKNIITTVVQGRDSSIDEFINNGDWSINIRGIIATNEPRYPLWEVQDLEEHLARKDSISIEHEVMNGLGIFDIVVLGFELKHTPMYNIQTYSISAKSTDPLPLIVDLKEKERVY